MHITPELNQKIIQAVADSMQIEDASCSNVTDAELFLARRCQQLIQQSLDELDANPRRVYEIVAAHKQRMANLGL